MNFIKRIINSIDIFVIFIFIIILLYCVLLIISRDIVYGLLIPIEYLVTMFFAFYILKKDLDTLVYYKVDVFVGYRVEGQKKIDHCHVLNPLYLFGIGIILLLITLYVFVTLPGGCNQHGHVMAKTIKFVVSQIIMIGFVHSFSKINGKILIDILGKDLEKVMMPNLSNE